MLRKDAHSRAKKVASQLAFGTGILPTQNTFYKKGGTMIKDKLKGLWIPSEVILDNNISDKEKLIYALILFFSFQTGSCYLSPEYESLDWDSFYCT